MRTIMSLLVAALVAVAGCAPTEFVDPYGAQAQRQRPTPDIPAGK
ncbi:MAG TPA: hypothetical protein VGE72_12525 [Azospirillum sp.]